MKKSLLISIALMFIFTISKAQTALQILGPDCNGNQHDLFADLDAGKAVVVFFFMPSCGACPPPAQKVQAMANNIMATHPGMVTGYAMPYNNTTSCGTTSSWVTSSGVPFYAPYDSGAVQVAQYGGFGMPSVVLLGGSGLDKRVMFSTLSFSTSDTTIMKDSILAMINSATGINDLPNAVSSFGVYPNPADINVTVNLNLKESAIIMMDVIDMNGKQVAIISNEKQSGLVTKQFSAAELPAGNYFVRIQANGKAATQKFTVSH